MLGKLLKYDIKSQGKSLLPMYLIALGFALATRGMKYVVDAFPVVSAIYSFMIAMCIFSFIGVVIWTMIVAIKQFYFNMLKDEGYLTNTLPVTRNQIILSKELTSVVYMVVATAVVILAAMLAFYHGGMKSFLAQVTEVLSINGVDSGRALIWIIVMMAISYISYIQMAFTSLMIGQTQNMNKILFSIVAAIIIYVIQSILSLGVLAIDMWIDPNLMDVMSTSNPLLSDVWQYVELVFSSTMILILVTMVVFHVISVFLANRKLNLE
ncbi:MAG: ABC-2 transporter permease [Longicatena sp.]